MKLITAIIQPEKFETVKAALLEANVHGITVSEASGYGRQRGHTEIYRGVEHTVDLIAKVRIEIVTTDQLVDSLVECIVKSAQTGQVGDGKIWVTDIEKLVRVRTGDENEAAL